MHCCQLEMPWRRADPFESLRDSVDQLQLQGNTGGVKSGDSINSGGSARVAELQQEDDLDELLQQLSDF